MSDWSKLAADLSQVTAGIAILFGSIGGLRAYYKTKRKEAAQWVFDVFQPFQIGDEFDTGKKLLDFEHQAVVEPLLGEMIFHDSPALDRASQDVSVHIDRVLNYLEHICYLEQEGMVTRQDRETYFGYWFSLLKRDNRGALRRYCVRFDYNNLAQFTQAHKEEYVLVYGTLKQGYSNFSALELDDKLEYIAELTILGELYDLGSYPGMIEGEDKVHAQLFRVRDMKVLQLLDTLEEWQHDQSQSLYRRACARVRPEQFLSPNPPIRQNIDAWVYYYNQPISGYTKVSNSNWVE